MSIRNQMIILVILMAGPLFGFIFYTAMEQREDDIKEAFEISTSIARQIGNDQYTMHAGAKQLAVILSRLPAVARRDAAASNELLAALIKANPQYVNLVLADKGGAVWASARPHHSPLSIADRRYFRNVIMSGKPSSGEYLLSPILHKPVLNFGYPLFDANTHQVTGVIGIAFTLDGYTNLYSADTGHFKASILLLDHKGTIVYFSDDPRLAGRQDRAELFRRMTGGRDTGTFEDTGNTGVRRLFAYKKVRLEDEQTPYLYVRVGLNKGRVLAESNRHVMRSLGFFSTIMLLMLGAVIYTGKRTVLDKIIALRDATRRISGGDLAVRVSDRISGGELGELGRAFDDMARALADDYLKIREAEEALKENAQQYRELVESANCIILKFDSEGRVTFFNEFAERFFGFSQDEIVGRSLIGTIVPEVESSGRSLKEMIANIIKDPEAFGTNENENIRKDGRRVWIAWNNHLLPDAEGHVDKILSVGQDITARRLAEETLRHSEEKFAAIFRISPDSININRVEDDVFVDVNDGFTTMLGYTTEEVIGTSATKLGIWVDPDFRRRLVRDLMGQESVNNRETQLRRKDGTIIVGQISCRIIEIDGITCTLSITRDITDRDYIQSELIKAQKLESISILAGGIAHNFNNVLTGVIGYISFAKKHLDDAAKTGQMLDMAEKASFRAASLARQLLTFARGGEPIKQPVPVEQLLRESVFLFLSGTNVRGVIDCASQQMVKVDRDQINQAFNNIVLNSLHAMTDGGVLTVRAEETAIGKGNIYKLEPGKYVRITFEDTGCGIRNEDIPRVFDPYFTTKDTGTGLGLASTYSIVKKHGGYIGIASEAGKGTTVTIILPSAGKMSAGHASERMALESARSGVSLLVVDDNETIRNLLFEMLVDLKYEVTLCSNGEAAIDLYQGSMEAGHPFSLVIMDLVIPAGMSGLDAARRILELDPKARIIVSSGYSNDPVMAGYQDHGFCAAIAKPYNAASLSRILREALS